MMDMAGTAARWLSGQVASVPLSHETVASGSRKQRAINAKQ
jgi:hypothetical protein